MICSTTVPADVIVVPAGMFTVVTFEMPAGPCGPTLSKEILRSVRRHLTAALTSLMAPDRFTTHTS